MLLGALLLLGATIGWSAVASRGQDGLVHSGNRSAHDVGAAHVRIVRRSWFAHMPHWCDCCQYYHHGSDSSSHSPNVCREWENELPAVAPARTAKTHGWWLLWETTAIALATHVAFVVIGECAWLLSRGVAAAWGLLAGSHAELLDVCKLVLHWD
jgi:hypothetical protein